MMLSRLMLAVGFIAIAISAQNASACGHAISVEQKASAEQMMKDIAKKFALTTEVLAYKCGGAVVELSFVPPTPIVPPDSFFAGWNRSFPLGMVEMDQSTTNETLEKILAIAPEKMEALKAARVVMVRDKLQLSNEFGVDFYLYPKKFTAVGGLMAISAPLCKDDMYQSAQNLGDVEMPVATIEGLIAAPEAKLYEEGDAVKAIRANENALAALSKLIDFNIQDQKNRQGTYRGSKCGTVHVGDVEHPLSWEQTAQLFMAPSK